MSVTPITHSHHLQREDATSIKQAGLSRQGSFGSSEDESISAENEFRASHAESSHNAGHSQGRGSNSLSSKIVQNIYFQIFITLLTVLTLVLYDIKTIVCTKEQDFAVGIANCLFFAVFMVEIAMNVKTEGYFCSFFFFLDLVSTVTLLFDVDFIIDAIFNQSSNFQVSSFVAKSKASRVAARAVRVVKIFRLARVAKLYKSTQRAKELSEKDKLAILEKENSRVRGRAANELENAGNNNEEASNHNLASRTYLTRKNLNTGSNIERYELENDSIKEEPLPSNERTEHALNHPNKVDLEKPEGANNAQNGSQLPQPDSQNKESQISKILTEDTIKKIVIIILLIMMEIPLLSLNNFANVSTQWDLTASFLANALPDPTVPLPAIAQLIHLQIAAFPNSGVQASFICVDSPFADIATCAGVDFSQFRTADLGVYSQSINTSAVVEARPSVAVQAMQTGQGSGDSIILFVNYSKYNSLDAGFSIATTTFICLTIIYLLGSFSGNINELVIVPIERMLNLVRARDYREEERQDGEDKGEEYETKLVQQAIIKIKDLMETIYGPLGNDLVQEKMLNNKSISVNLMESIKKSFCVAAVCKLNHITKITALLGEDAFGLINEIAVIVHNAAFRYGGYCTKVLDHGFLIIFKVGDSEIEKYKIDEDIDPKLLPKSQDKAQQAFVNTFCDFSIYFALKTLARIVKQPKLFKYRNDQRLLRGFGGVFNIEMNFAFTMGWCSEAVIGSSHKIDPLFLGGEITHLERVIRISQNYPSSILVTESLHCNLSPGLKFHTRPFDAVKLDEELPERRIYFVDYDPTNVSPSLNAAEKVHKEVKDLRTKKAMNLLYLSGVLKGEKAYNATTFISRKKELSQILRKIVLEDPRRKRYEATFEKYVKGEWADCQQLLESEILKNDIPAQRLYSFLQGHNFKAPPSWKGFRLYHDLFPR